MKPETEVAKPAEHLVGVGFVGAGGIGQELYTVISFNYYQEIGAILTLIIITVSLIDMVSERLRVRAIGQAG